MYTLKGIFPEPKKEHKRNFIKENMLQVKLLQEKTTSNQSKFSVKSGQSQSIPSPMANGALGPVKSSTSNKSFNKMTSNVMPSNVVKPNMQKKVQEVKIKKGDMAEFLKRKEQRHQKPPDDSDDEAKSSESSGRVRDMACQTADNVDSSKMTVLYPEKHEEMRASGDMAQQHLGTGGFPQRTLEAAYLDNDKRNKTGKDPYLPTGYQRGVMPKYLRGRREESEVVCPPGHVTLPDHERRETLRMLRNSFAELVSELNKMPVKTDTLRMRNRKMELEKQLAKLEEGIKVFSRPKVFVKIGE